MDIEEIILKETENRLSAQDVSRLKAWIDENPRNKKIYNQVKLILERRGKDTSNTGKEEVWVELNQRIDRTAKEQRPAKKSVSIARWLRYAAIILLSAGLGALIHQFQPGQKTVTEIVPQLIEKVSQPGQKITTRLPDGTVVKLNANSRIITPEVFQEDIRRVELHGEAFFDVVQDTSRPFIITIGDMEVKVLGTSFNVKEDGDLEQKIVAVKSGKVAVEDKNSGELVVLNPSQLVVQNKNEGLYKKDFTEEEGLFAWTENKLVLNDDDHEKVLREIGYWFGKEVEVRGNIDREVKYTAIYENPTLEEVLLSTSHIFKFQYKIHENRIIIE